MYLDSFVDSLTVACRDFKSQFYGILIHNMNALFSAKEKLCSQKIIQLPLSNYLSYGIFQGAWFYIFKLVVSATVFSA